MSDLSIMSRDGRFSDTKPLFSFRKMECMSQSPHRPQVSTLVIFMLRLSLLALVLFAGIAVGAAAGQPRIRDTLAAAF